MPTLKEVKKELEFVATFKNIVSTFQEVASIKMNQIRNDVLKNRGFCQELLKTYKRIRSAYWLSLKKEGVRKIIFRQIKKGLVVVFLSANKLFYGPLLLEIWNQVKNFLKNNKGDLVVIGRVGKYLAEREKTGWQIFYFDLDDTKPEEDKIGQVLDFIKDYERIMVFHGKYERGFLQKPTITDISGGLPTEKEKQINIKYIFEPSAEAVLGFFEREIIGVIFHLAILEHQLARYGARVWAMYQAGERAKNIEKKLKGEEKKLQKALANKKQIEIFNSLKL